MKFLGVIAFACALACATGVVLSYVPAAVVGLPYAPAPRISYTLGVPVNYAPVDYAPVNYAYAAPARVPASYVRHDTPNFSYSYGIPSGPSYLKK